MPTTSTLAGLDLGRLAWTEGSPIVATTTFDPQALVENQKQQSVDLQQQVVAVSPQLQGFDIGHWTPSDATALINALVASFSVILVSELGDKTFIITAIMAMKNSRLLVFMSSALALFLMTVLSVGMGVAVTMIPKLYTHYASIVLFLCFGLKMLKEAYDMRQDDDESEFEEVERSLESDVHGCKATNQQKLAERGRMSNLQPIPENESSSNPIATTVKPDSLAKKISKSLNVAPLIIKVFTMVFVAEWGDRSQISTVILAAREDVVGVFIGSFVGHVLCTGLAVIGGRFVAEMISVKTSKYHSNGLIYSICAQ